MRRLVQTEAALQLHGRSAGRREYIDPQLPPAAALAKASFRITFKLPDAGHMVLDSPDCVPCEHDSLRTPGAPSAAPGVALQSEPYDLGVIAATTSRLLISVRLSPCFTRGNC